MIKSLYPQFQYWSSTGSVYIISDTHFEDKDCLFMDPEWITPQEHIDKIKKVVRKGDTLIHLGDVGNGEWLTQIPASYKILITGNHDVLSKVSKYFDEVYTGPLFIADRILLSHEPIEGLENFCYNIHGHDHGHTFRSHHLNLAANVYKYRVFNLGAAIKGGLLSQIKNYHCCTIDNATLRKQEKEEYTKYFGEKFANELDRAIHMPNVPRDFIFPNLPNENFIPEACKNCSNHPYNGGSGVCNCILGLPKITC